MSLNNKIFLLCFLCAFSLQAQTLSLQSAIDTTLKFNSDLIISDYDQKALEHSKKSVHVERYGKIDFKLDYNHYNTPRTLMPLTPPINPNVSTSDDLIGATFSYTLPLFDGFEKTSEIKILDLREKMQEKQRFILEKNLIFNVKATFFKALSLQNQLKITEQYVEYTKAFLEQIQLKENSGKASKLDVLHAKVNYTQSLAKQKNIQSDLEILKAYLAQLMHQEKCEYTLEEIMPATIFVSTPSSFKDLQSLQIYSLEEQRKEQELEKVRSLYYPKVDFFASHLDVYGAGDHALISQYGLSFRWNIFDFGKKSNLLEKSSLELLKAKTQSDKKRLEIIRKQKELQEKCLKLDEAIKTYEEELSLKQSILEIEKIKYEEGKATILDFIEAKNHKENSHLSLIDARYNRMIAGFELDNLLEK